MSGVVKMELVPGRGRALVELDSGERIAAAGVVVECRVELETVTDVSAGLVTMRERHVRIVADVVLVAGQGDEVSLDVRSRP